MLLWHGQTNETVRTQHGSSVRGGSSFYDFS